MFCFLANLFRKKYNGSNVIQIIKENILHNYNLLQSQQPQAEIFPVLKSNAYGHGIKEICSILKETNAKMIAVNSLEETLKVYRFSKKKVLVISELSHHDYRYCNLKRTEFYVYNLETLKFLTKFCKQVKIHLFVNTGMNREGISDLKLFLEKSQKYLKKIKIVGLCSQLASTEENSALHKKQEAKFFECLEILNEKKIYPTWLHLGNSAGTFSLKDKRFTAFRTGISFYGYNVFSKNAQEYEHSQKLKPALKIKSKITAMQNLQKGDSVAGHETFKVKKDTTIATIPFGYYEGLDCRLSNQGILSLKNKKESFYASIAGHIDMNISCLNCENNHVNLGDEVEIFSELIDKKNSIQNFANIMKITPYEILVKLAPHIYREII